ncbi:MAG: heme ABC transporter permease [Alphaproteobacteria bacterium]
MTSDADTQRRRAQRPVSLANPTRFFRIANRLLPWASGATAILFAVGLYLALFASPPDYQQSETVRIAYVHVPAAWMALFVYVLMAVASGVGLVWRHALALMAARAAAPAGLVFTAICLATGSLWGEPMWGTWWEWDARMTSVLVLLFFYLGYVALIDAFDDPMRGQQSASILCLVGVVNVPIVKFSVDWFSTLHQGASVFRLDGPTIHPAMLAPMLVMALAFTLLFFVVLVWRMRGLRARARLSAAASLAASEGA